MKIRFLVIPVIVAATGAVAVGIVRKEQARSRAKKLTEELKISTDYEIPSILSTNEEGLTAIWKLAEWEEETKEAINTGYGLALDEKLKPSSDEGINGYASREDLDAYMRLLEWRKQRAALKQEVEDTLREIFEKDKAWAVTKQEEVLACYEDDLFPDVLKTMKKVNKADFYGAYKDAENIITWNGGTVSMDIIYGLYPEEIKEAGEQFLADRMEDKAVLLSFYVDHAKLFEDRYHVELAGLDKARRKIKQAEYNSKPEIPKAGMTTSLARSTKLGSPTRTTKEQNSWAHKKHTYGDMVWERSGRQIFRAHYLDGEITDVYDSRNVSTKSYRSRSSGGSSSSSRRSSSSSSSRRTSSFDPDDHDIEAYYEDNRDEYDDYDDAYEGFLDDDSAWDDY